MTKRCPGYPPGTCLTDINRSRELCSYCWHTRQLAEDFTSDPRGPILRVMKPRGGLKP